MNADLLLERTQWDTFWVPPDTTVVDRPELLFTAHPGGAPMLNAVHRLASAEHLSERDRTYIRLVQQGLERVANTSRKLLDFSPRVVDPVGR